MTILNQKEMIDLIVSLNHRGIKIREVRSFFDGLQVICEDGWDAICHSGSYGHEEGLIEVMGLPDCCDGVLGNLTAEEVLAMVDKYK